MDLNTKGRYAVMAVADLARSGAEPVSLAAIAERQQISLAYLEQLFMKLRRAGLVESERGRTGGYRLARPARLLAVGDILAAVEEPIEMTRCRSEGLPGGCVGHERCLTHDLWDALGDHIRGFLDDVTIADVLAGTVRERARLAEPVHAGVAAE